MSTIVRAIFISPEKGVPMKPLDSVTALRGFGLEGDRYANFSGSYSMDTPGKRQVTIMHNRGFADTDFEWADSRRNIIVDGDLELPSLDRWRFQIGTALFEYDYYCTVCKRPNKLSGKEHFQTVFHERGGIVVRVVHTGVIKVGDVIEKVEKLL